MRDASWTVTVSGQLSLFERLSRFSPTLRRTPREDRLTEGLAACLEAAPEAAYALAGELFGLTPPAGLVQVATQVADRDYGRADLLLVFGGQSAGLRLQFEVKVDSPAYAEQMERYVRWQTSLGGEWRLAWLLPVDAKVPSHPSEALARTWQDVASALNAWLKDLNKSEFGPGLVAQYLKHLEEQQLASIHGLSAQDIVALNGRRRAEAAAAGLVKQARERISSEWGLTADEKLRRDDVLNFYHQLPTQPKKTIAGQQPWPGALTFTWLCQIDFERDPSLQSREYAFATGVTFPAGRNPLPDTDWLNRRYDQLFEYGRYKSGAAILARWQPLRDLADLDGADAQVKAVVEHALATLRMLAEDPVPESALVADRENES